MMKHENARQISISNYAYDLPDDRIAKFPVTPRDSSRLLVYDHGCLRDEQFCNLASQLPRDALMIFNNTRVIHARLNFRKQITAPGGSPADGARIEVFLLEPSIPADYEQMFLTRGKCTWLCMVGNLKKWKEGSLRMSVSIDGRPVVVTASRVATNNTNLTIEFNWYLESDAAGNEATSLPTFADILDAAGQLPIPPYLNRQTQESDLTTYQTVYSKIKGSVAAPTAGLHFTPQVLQSLDQHGIDREELTLHVGAGTFKPVKSEHMDGHEMHTEHICVKRQTLQKLLAHGCQAVAVGTTSVRTLESLYYMGLKAKENMDLSADQLHISQWEPYDLDASTMQPARDEVLSAITALLQWLDHHDLDAIHASTQIIIAPGYSFKIVSHLITNFHQPQSTLLLLVSAFTRGQWKTIYSHALEHGYRFLSYGDSSLLIP